MEQFQRHKRGVIAQVYTGREQLLYRAMANCKKRINTSSFCMWNETTLTVKDSLPTNSASVHNQKGNFQCIQFINSGKVPMLCMLKAFLDQND